MKPGGTVSGETDKDRRSAKRKGFVAQIRRDIGPDRGRRFRNAGVAVLLVFALGTLGYVLVEGVDWFDALYMTVITVTTVGYSEVFPLGTGGRVLNIFVTLFGVGTILYVASVVAEYLVSGELGGAIGQRRMNRHIAGMSGHYVVCGYGRTGRQVVEELQHAGQEVVVVDNNEDEVGNATDNGIPAVLGDSGSDDTLRAAGIERAAGLVAAVAPDAEVLMAVLSARSLNQDLSIVARSENEDSVSKMRSAGANRVMSIHRIAGHRLAQMVIRPEVAEFLEVVLTDHEVEVEMDMVRLPADSPFNERTLGETGLVDRSGTNIVGVRKHGGTLTVLATAGTVLNSGDVLVAIGTRQQLEGLKQIAASGL
jgi:voltage-gated potassium channel